MLRWQVEELEVKLSDQTEEVERLRSELVRLKPSIPHTMLSSKLSLPVTDCSVYPGSC